MKSPVAKDRALLPTILVAACAVATTLACAAEITVVTQKNRAFSVASLNIQQGDAIRFTNNDDFDHQVYVTSPSFSFDSDEKQPGQSLEIRFPVRGTFEVHCHIHPKMRLEVHVQ